MSSTTHTQAELSSKTVKDLKAILADLKLAQTGVKADLISRILEHQSGNGIAAPEASSSGANAAPATTAPTQTASSGTTSTTEPATAAEVGGADANGASTASATGPSDVENANGNAAAAAMDLPPAPAATDKMSEAEKRMQRLKRFGNTDELAKLERAEKFGTQADTVNDKSISRLDSELSNKRQRKDKSDAPAAANNGTAAPKASSKPANQNGAANPKPNKSGNAGKPASSQQSQQEKKKAVLDPAEEERRRKRAERFGAAPAAA